MIGKNLPEHGLDLSRSIHLTAIEANDVAVLGEEVGHLARIFIVPCLQQLLVNRPNLSYIAAFGFVHISLGRIHKYLHFSSALLAMPEDILLNKDSMRIGIGNAPVRVEFIDRTA